MVPRNRVIRRIMLVVCPSCTASYRLGAAALGPNGRTVRCAACRTTWFVPADNDEERLSPPAAAEDETAEARPGRPSLHLVEAAATVAEPAEERPALRARRRPPRRAAAKSMRVQLRPALLVVAMGALVFAGGLLWRRTVVGMFPQAEPIYSAVGLPVNLRGLAFRDVASAETIENGTPMLHISGRIENVSGAPANVPRLRLAVRGTSGREIYVWTAVPAKTRLAAGEILPFRAELASPPAAGRDVAVRFLTARDLTASLSEKSGE
jgi:predicted Zn finger-like uncharacterized protein